MGKRQDRFRFILDHLLKNQAASVRELSELLDVTEMTIRRDLAELTDSNKIKFIQGVAINNNTFLNDEYSLAREEHSNTMEKQRIGHKAAELIEPHDIVFLDSGTTVGYILNELKMDIPLTIITNCLRHVSVVQKNSNWELIVPGGMLQRLSMTLVNNDKKGFPSSVRISKAFLSTTGISRKLGVTCPYLYESDLKKAAIELSEKTFLVADHSKFDKISINHFADLQSFGCVITDDKIPENYITFLEDNNIELIIV